MSTIVHAAILGVVQGLTEFLPVSSTAHLLIGGRLLGFDDPGSVFTEMIQLGSILAIMWVYRARIVTLLTGVSREAGARRVALAIVAAFLPAGIAGLLASDYVEGVLHQSVPVISVAFIVGGLVMLLVERFGPHPTVTEMEGITAGQALGIGLCQTLALIPGVSRSGATIVGGMLMGLGRPAAAEFSFFVAMPTMAGAFAHSAWQMRDQITAGRLSTLAVGFVAAFVAAALVVKPFLAFIRRAGFAPFAWYRIAAGVVLVALLGAGWL